MRRTDSTKFMGPTQIPSDCLRVCACFYCRLTLCSRFWKAFATNSAMHIHKHACARLNYPRCVVDKFQADWLGFAAQLFGCLRVADIRMHMVWSVNDTHSMWNAAQQSTTCIDIDPIPDSLWQSDLWKYSKSRETTTVKRVENDVLCAAASVRNTKPNWRIQPERTIEFVGKK